MSNNITTKLQAILSAKGDIKDAIEGKGVTVGSASLDQYASKIEQISGGGGEENYDDDVIFIDYDGTVLYRYTAQEFLALTEMPANPSHDDLTAQGWNWTLADAKTYVTSAGGLVIGQMYVGKDEKTRLFITLDDPNYLSPAVVLYNGDIVDWGDGSTPQTMTTSATIEHTYGSVGDYVITITQAGTALNNLTALLPEEIAIYKATLKKCYLGKTSTSIGTYFLSEYVNLEYVTIPPYIETQGSGGLLNKCISLKAFVFPISFTSGANLTLGNCYGIKIISINKVLTVTGNNFLSGAASLLRFSMSPSMLNSSTYSSNPSSTYALKKVDARNDITYIRSFSSSVKLVNIQLGQITSIPGSCFSSSISLKKITIPQTVTSIGIRAFEGTFIPELTIPSGVTSIGNYAFYNCSMLKIVHMKPTTPPTAGTGIFQSTDVVKIYVPAASVETYKGASGWSAYAGKIEAEPTT